MPYLKGVLPTVSCWGKIFSTRTLIRCLACWGASVLWLLQSRHVGSVLYRHDHLLILLSWADGLYCWPKPDTTKHLRAGFWQCILDVYIWGLHPRLFSAPQKHVKMAHGCCVFIEKERCLSRCRHFKQLCCAEFGKCKGRCWQTCACVFRNMGEAPGNLNTILQRQPVFRHTNSQIRQLSKLI